jgi:hypothetical protein
VRRATPNFFLVGAPQAGTTSLYFYLDQHPSIFVSPIKEPCFFAPEVADITPRARDIYDADAAALRRYLDGPLEQKRDRGLVLDWDDYLLLFKNVRDQTAIGEASVAYLASPAAATAIRARVPGARIVMILRNPVDRLFSRFLATRDRGSATTFVGWLGERVAEDEGRHPPSGPIWPGRYGIHLRRYLDAFPPGQVRVFLYDDYVHSPDTVLRELFAFLGVDPDHPIDTTRRHNVSMMPRWPMLHARLRPLRGVVPDSLAARARSWYLTPRRFDATAEERARALEVYRDDIRALEKLIGRDLSRWLSTG